MPPCHVTCAHHQSPPRLRVAALLHLSRRVAWPSQQHCVWRGGGARRALLGPRRRAVAQRAMGCGTSCELSLDGPRITASELLAAAAAGDVDTGMKALLMDGVSVASADTNGWCAGLAPPFAATFAVPAAARLRCDWRPALLLHSTCRALRLRAVWAPTRCVRALTSVPASAPAAGLRCTMPRATTACCSQRCCCNRARTPRLKATCVRPEQAACGRTQARGALTALRAQNEATAISLAQSDEMRAVLKQAVQRPRACPYALGLCTARATRLSGEPPSARR